MRLSGVTFWEILFVVSISAPLAFAQSYSAGGGSTPARALIMPPQSAAEAAPHRAFSAAPMVIAAPRRALAAVPLVLSALRRAVAAVPMVLAAGRRALAAVPMVLAARRRAPAVAPMVLAARRQALIAAPMVLSAWRRATPALLSETTPTLLRQTRWRSGQVPLPTKPIPFR
jgi:hypothetical protein